MNYFIESLGLVTAGDIVSLAPGLQIRDRMLFDHANGARHIISSTVRDVLNALGRGVEISQWYAYATELGLNDVQWMALIGFLNSIGGLVIRRTWKAQIGVTGHRIRWRLRGISLNSHANRTTASFKGVTRAICNASGQLAVLTLIISLLSIIAGMPYFAMLSVSCFCILWLTTIMHEHVHVMLSSSSNHTPVIIVRGLRLGIVHHQLSRKRNILSALLGPLMGIVSAVFLGLIGQVADVQVVVQASVVVCVFHALSWMPAYGDGQALKKEIKSLMKGMIYEKTTSTSAQRRRTTRQA